MISPGSVFEVYTDVKNHGQKVARHLEMFFLPAGPFVTPQKEKTRFKRAKLIPGDSWEVKFKIKIKKTARIGTYPLYLSCTAKNAEPSSNVRNITIVSKE